MGNRRTYGPNREDPVRGYADAAMEFPSELWALEQAQEVQTGLWLLQQSLNTLQTSVTNTAMHSHIDNTIRNLLSINAVLRSLNIQEFTPPANATDLEGTWRVSLATDLLQVHVNFLRGKVHLLLSSAQACKPDVS
ncbi:erythropoietin [Neolamprologus brichardi]|uniref:erythropoietin n=1 Tax=Neolamprologus brichardi TaxID=32507 RepID=UPI001643CBE0|nr:erythropoietin [Neolamprologus brichardi]